MYTKEKNQLIGVQDQSSNKNTPKKDFDNKNKQKYNQLQQDDKKEVDQLKNDEEMTQIQDNQALINQTQCQKQNQKLSIQKKKQDIEDKHADDKKIEKRSHHHPSIGRSLTNNHSKLELTDAEKELLLGNNYQNSKLESKNEEINTPTYNSTLGKRNLRKYLLQFQYFRMENSDNTYDFGGRQRRPKQNFFEDYVYTYDVMRSTYQKPQKDQQERSSQKSNNNVSKQKKSIKTNKQKEVPKQEVSQCPKEEPIKLYCLCRTADDSAFMIGCDRCDEWYHLECVGIDPATIEDFNKLEFVCPECQKKQQQKPGDTQKKRNQKAIQKKEEIYQPNILKNQTASVQQKRNIKKNLRQNQQVEKGKKVRVIGKEQEQGASRVILSTNLGGKIKEKKEELEMEQEIDGNGIMINKQNLIYQKGQGTEYRKRIGHSIIQGGQLSKQNEQLDKVVSNGNYIYFLTKENKEQEQSIKLPVDNRLSIRMEQLENLNNIFNKKGEEEGMVNQILDMLRTKLKENLTKIPSIYKMEEERMALDQMD